MEQGFQPSSPPNHQAACLGERAGIQLQVAPSCGPVCLTDQKGPGHTCERRLWGGGCLRASFWRQE